MDERQPETPWRQGHVLTAVSAQKLGLIHPDGEADDPIVLVVSHDCDLAAPSQMEPDCEVILGRHIEAPDGAYTNAKSPRKLHLTFSAGTVRVIAEFIATDKRKITKDAISQDAPSTNVRLTRDEFTILQSWLAARYRRPSFPDDFEARFKKKRTDKKLADIVAKSGNHLLAVFFDVDSGLDVVRQAVDDAYSLGIYLVFKVTDDPSVAEIAAKDTAKAITSLITNTFLNNGKWEGIELLECDAIAESVMSLYEGRMYKQWQFDYLSLRTNPQGDTLEPADKGD
jgi:hypothetical protein